MLECSLIFNTWWKYICLWWPCTFIFIVAKCLPVYGMRQYLYFFLSCQKFSQSDIIINNHVEFTIISFVLSGSKGQELKSFRHHCKPKLGRFPKEIWEYSILLSTFLEKAWVLLKNDKLPQIQICKNNFSSYPQTNKKWQ